MEPKPGDIVSLAFKGWPRGRIYYWEILRVEMISADGEPLIGRLVDDADDMPQLEWGVGLTFRFPLESIGWDAMHVGIRLAYQYGTSQLSSTFGYTAHILPVDVSLGWRLWHGRWGELSLGPRLRFAPLLQSLEQPPNKDEQILSMMYEAGGMLQWQLHLTSTWFVRLDIDGGVRLFDLGGDWVARGVASFSLGGGWRW